MRFGVCPRANVRVALAAALVSVTCFHDLSGGPIAAPEPNDPSGGELSEPPGGSGSFPPAAGQAGSDGGRTGHDAAGAPGRSGTGSGGRMGAGGEAGFGAESVDGAGKRGSGEGGASASAGEVSGGAGAGGANAGGANAEPSDRGICSVDDWCWQFPLPQGNSLDDIFVAGNNDVWFAGYGGMLLRFKDGVWSNTISDNGQIYQAVWGSSEHDIWATGFNGAMLHWTGNGWRNDATTEILTVLSGSAADDVWGAGFGDIFHYDGEEWQAVSSPSSTWILDLVSVSRSAAWGAGLDGSVLRFAGGAWSVFAELAGQSNYAVWSTSDDEVWVFGISDEFQEIGSHWDGESWKSFPHVGAQAAWGTPDGQIWTVGYASEASHWTGTEWITETVQSFASLSAIDGLDANDIWATGLGGDIFRRQGGVWQLVSIGTEIAFLGRALWVDERRGVAVGENGTALRLDGDVWRDEELGVRTHLRGVWGAGDETWAVGDAGTILHDRAGVWEASESGSTEALLAVDGTASNDIWSVGAAGTILHYDGEEWSAVDCPVDVALRAVWAASPSLAWAVGDAGTTLQWNGETWSSIASGTTSVLRAVHGAGATEVWAAGANSTLLRWNGAEWLPQSLGVTVELHSVAVAAPDEVWIGASQGSLWRFQGEAFELAETTLIETILAIRPLPSGAVLLGNSGGILRHRPP